MRRGNGVNAIEIMNLSKTFAGRRRTRVEAIKGLSLTIEAGEIFGFLGPNGAGKSTTIKTIMGLIRPTSGAARIMGVEVSSAEARRHVGYLPENPAFYEYLTAEEYLSFVGATFAMPAAAIRSESERVLKLLELWDARKRAIRSYSKGMVQRLGLAQVLIHGPDVCILDEPMSGLDPVGRALVKDIMLDLKNRGKCVFFSTHITADVESVCDRVGIITNGTLQRLEKVQTILKEGIEGYVVSMDDTSGSGQPHDLFVARDELPGFMATAHERGNVVTLVEPKRKDLEAFFLDIVKGA